MYGCLQPHAICCSVPFFHAFAATVGLLSGLYHGAKLVSPAPSFEAAPTLRAIEQEKCALGVRYIFGTVINFHRCTSVYGTPTMFVDMLNVQKQKGFDMSSLETGIMGGAPAPVELCRNLVKHMNLKDFAVYN